MKVIHDRIKGRREALGLSMEQLAALVGVSWQTVQQWENGKTAPKRLRLEAVAKALRTTPEYLSTGTASTVFPSSSYSTIGEWPFKKVTPSEWKSLPIECQREAEGFVEGLVAALTKIKSGRNAI